MNTFSHIIITWALARYYKINHVKWANWGGLNDVQRNQEFSMGISANDYTFGDLAGTNNIIMRASMYRRGGRISYASANRSYQGRVMASYSSGLLEGGWSYSVLGSRRFGENGYIDGTLYDANSFFVAVETPIMFLQCIHSK